MAQRVKEKQTITTKKEDTMKKNKAEE